MAGKGEPPMLEQKAGGAVSFFPTICWVRRQPDSGKINAALEELILRQEKEAKNLVTSSVRGGYHSDRGFFDQDHWAVQELKQRVTAEALDYLRVFWKHESAVPLDSIPNVTMRLTGWSVVLRAGSMSAPHLHPRATISGVYYVTPYKPKKEEHSDAGCLVLLDPRVRAPVFPVRGQGTSVVVPPEEGNLVMFPGYMEHFVMPFKGEGHRISIAFNFMLSENAVSQAE